MCKQTNKAKYFAVLVLAFTIGIIAPNSTYATDGAVDSTIEVPLSDEGEYVNPYQTIALAETDTTEVTTEENLGRGALLDADGQVIAGTEERIEGIKAEATLPEVVELMQAVRTNIPAYQEWTNVLVIDETLRLNDYREVTTSEALEQLQQEIIAAVPDGATTLAGKPLYEQVDLVKAMDIYKTDTALKANVTKAESFIAPTRAELINALAILVYTIDDTTNIERLKTSYGSLSTTELVKLVHDSKEYAARLNLYNTMNQTQTFVDTAGSAPAVTAVTERYNNLYRAAVAVNPGFTVAYAGSGILTNTTNNNAQSSTNTAQPARVPNTGIFAILHENGATLVSSLMVFISSASIIVFAKHRFSHHSRKIRKF